MTMSDRIALLHKGELEQIASPEEIYRRPATAYVAQFIGQTNLLHANVSAGIATYGELQWRTTESDGPATFSLRPECILAADSAPHDGSWVRFRATIANRVFQGASELCRLQCSSGIVLLMKTAGNRSLEDRDFAFATNDVVRVRN